MNDHVPVRKRPINNVNQTSTNVRSVRRQAFTNRQKNIINLLADIDDESRVTSKTLSKYEIGNSKSMNKIVFQIRIQKILILNTSKYIQEKFRISKYSNFI